MNVTTDVLITVLFGGGTSFLGAFIAMKIGIARLEERLHAQMDRIEKVEAAFSKQLETMQDSLNWAHRRIDEALKQNNFKRVM